VTVAALFAVVGALAAPAGEAAPPKPEEPKKPQAVFTLADGSRVVGDTSVKEVVIKTAYGDVTVPIADVLRLRVARSSDRETRDRVAALIKQLGAANFDDREKAYDELTKMGPVALGQLRDAAKHPDAEVRSRVEKLLVDLERVPDEEAEEEDGPLGGDVDELVARHFTLRGVIKLEKFDVKTRYGKLEIPRDDIVTASFARPDAATKNLKVTGTHTLASMLGTGLRLKPGDRVMVRASGTINFRNWGENCGPDGNQDRFGAQPNNLPGMALVGRIGQNGKPFLLGSSKQFAAEGEGELFVGLAFGRNTGETTGEYKVRVVATPKAK
jgi:hypothetical protein